ncbi:peptide ABC transporter permease [Acrocarpospora pleiomorpha]|uniref:Peptide ABC transporter permease n=1 Tax=Acrocarpospora pleiomorpha TaxID=90975 RepID=A0A5M3XKR2_9ACTN|nr:ABC transporter permease [Acrocarpospora pleiomorpha]GES21462.1 peptide ABC transporter permease [Acrocarpospora pleiomorpha]
MTGYAARRVGQAVLVLWAAYTLTFFAVFLLPSDAAEIMAAGSDSTAGVDAATLAAFRARFGLDQPVYVQYVQALGRALRGDLGTSTQTGSPVTQMLVQALGPTMLLAALGMLGGILLGSALALVTTFVPGRGLRNALAAVPAVGVSVPTFCVGLVLLQLVSFRWGLLPAFGSSGAESLILPVLSLSLPVGALIAQLLSRSIEAEQSAEYAEIALAKGLSRLRVHLAHVARNALLPALTMAGVLAGELFGGSIVAETVFSRAGLGRLALAAVGARDLPVILGVVTVGACVFTVVNLAVDLLYPLLDPRIAVSR